MWQKGNFGRLSTSIRATIHNFRILGITDEHVIAVESLPSLHGDPFGQLLTRDKAVAAYTDTIITV